MPILTFSKRDLLRGKIVEAGWYRVRIDEVGEEPAANGKSINYPIEATILFNADTGDKTYEGVPIGGVPNWMFNSKGLGFASKLIEAVTGEPVTEGSRFELGHLVGKEVDVFIKPNEYNNRLSNRVEHEYRKPRA